MSADSEDPESTIPWPGFVDILSTVIIVFVFFMMLTSVIIFVLSQQDKSKAVEKVKSEQTTKEITQTIEQQTTKINQILLENKALKEQLAKVLQIKSVLSESEQQKTGSTTTEARIDYGDFGVTLQPATVDFLKGINPFPQKITIQTLIPKGNNFGSTREIALNRALNVRNVLIQEGVKPENITLKIIDASTQENTLYGSVIVLFNK
jgi:hypothetical protein